MATAAQRQHLAALMRWLIANEPLIHYQQRRPMSLTAMTEQVVATRFAGRLTVTSDCSETVTALCKWAGLSDPNGNSYNGSGYTGTLLGHLPHYSDSRAADVGALVVYGPGNGEHVSMVLSPGADPWLFSHGSESGPKRRRLSTERRLHAEPVTFLSIARL